MLTRKITIVAALMLAISGSAAFAQIDAAPTGFYADPVMADPPTTVAHAYRASEATADVAVVSPATGARAGLRYGSACTPLNPCAAATPAARG